MARTSLLSVLLLSLLPRLGFATEVAPPAGLKPAKKPIVESRVRLPVVDGNGKPIREVRQGPFRLELDLSEQVIRVDAPREESWRTPEERIRPGDTVVVVDQRAALQAGSAKLAELPPALRYLPDAVRDPGEFEVVVK